jgi:RNA recognition motif-containing protein
VPVKLVLPDISKPAHISAKTRRSREIQQKCAEDDKVAKEKEPESPERLARTLFVGNVPIALVQEKKLQRSFKTLFGVHGTVESIRFRSLVGEKAIPKRVVFEGHHLRVDIAANSEQKPATKKSIFVGNLPLAVNDESLWKVFESCGPILYVRVIRDKETGLGKGFGYVAFKEKAAVELAVQLNGSICEGRPLRVSKCAKPGYQQVKKARYEKRAVVKQQFKDMKKSHQNQPEAKHPAPSTSDSRTRPGQSRTTSIMPKLEAKHKPVPEELTPTQAKHPAEIRKERKLAKLASKSMNNKPMVFQKPSNPNNSNRKPNFSTAGTKKFTPKPMNTKPMIPRKPNASTAGPTKFTSKPMNTKPMVPRKPNASTAGPTKSTFKPANTKPMAPKQTNKPNTSTAELAKKPTNAKSAPIKKVPSAASVPSAKRAKSSIQGTAEGKIESSKTSSKQKSVK